MKFSKCMLSIVLMTAVSFAAITNFTTSKASYLSNDMVTYNYGSTSDTVYNQIWLETSGDTILTSADKVIYQYAMVDNDSTQSWGAGFNKMADSDTARHKFQFGPMPLNFPAARFYIRLKDANDSAYVSFTVTAITPKMTISGTVTPPNGTPPKNIWMSASARNGNQSYDGFTDANGDYTINVDSVGVATLDTLTVGINTDVGSFPGYRSVPAGINVSVKNGSVTGINFSFIALQSLVKGKISDKNGNGIKGMILQFNDKKGNTLFNAVSNDSGLYAISSDSGQYRLQVYCENKPGAYLFPPDTQFFIGLHDTQTINFTVVKCDTMLYGVIRKDGAPYSGKYGCGATSMSTRMMVYQDITASSFTLYVAKADSYYVWLKLGEGSDTVPAGYILKSNQIGHIRTGDTAFFDFIKPACAIRGRVKDTLGGWVSGCNVQLTMQDGNGNFSAITDDSGKYVCGLPQGIYTTQIDWSIMGKGYMHPNPSVQQFDTLHSGDTAVRDFTLLPADTVITGRVTFNGGKPTLRFAIATQSVATGSETRYEFFTTYDSLGYYTLKISKLKRDYYVGLAFGMSAFDTLAIGDTIEGGNFRLARAGEVVNFNVVSPPSSVLTHLRRVTSFGLDNVRMTGAGATITFAVPKQSQVSLRLYDMRGRLSATLANGIFDEGFHTVNLDAGRIAKAGYIIRMTWGQGQVTRKVLLVR